MTHPASNVDDLPNYHLATTLSESFEGMTHPRKAILNQYPLCYGADWPKLSPIEQRLMQPLRDAHLKAAWLPGDYDTLAQDAQKSARMSVLHGWFDRDHTNELITNLDCFIAANYLWVEFYEKASVYSRGFYFNRDPKFKYELLRMAFGPPKVPTEPAKTALHAPRSTTKTVTVIRQACKMIALNRPYTNILVSEINKDRCAEEMNFIRGDIENNELIHADFGGEGVLYPSNKQSRSGKAWKGNVLDFLHLPGVRINAYPINSGQRGRHPILLVIDDPEDEKTIADQKFRRKFLQNLFGRFLGMFYRGGVIIWMGTTIRGSCLATALMPASAQAEANTDDEVAQLLDTRFNDWNKFKIGMIRERADGTRESVMPDHMSLEGYDNAVKARGRVVMSAEADGEPLAHGEFALQRDEWRHGYMHCQKKRAGGGIDEYFLDLHTGDQKPWHEWLSGLYVSTGTDIADSLASDADLGGCMAVGIDTRRKVFVLDALLRKLIADDWPETSFQMAVEWGALRAGFETGTMQRVVVRMAQRLIKEYEDRGETPPKVVPIQNAGLKKHQRVLATLRPLYRKNFIAFPVFRPIEIGGTKHTPVEHPHRRSIGELLRQLDSYTDEGPSGYDDGPDALQIAIRTAGYNRGKSHESPDPVQAQLDKYRRNGMPCTPSMIPERMWTEEMREEVDGDMCEAQIVPAGKAVAVRRKERFDPYD
jgi:hypothetical protein